MVPKIKMPIITATWHMVINHMLITIAFLSLSFFVGDGRKIVNFQPLEMNREEVLNYFKSTYLTKLTSFDKMNEEVYQSETYAEDLFHNIDNLIPHRVFIKLLMKTKNITDKVDGKGIPFPYQSEVNDKCSSTSVFNLTTTQILLSWDGDRSIVANDIDSWHDANRNVPYHQLCNRFRGLTCQFKVAKSPEADQGMASEVSDKPTCQCSGDPANVGFYKNPKAKSKPTTPYGDGCYIRPWRTCRHLSLDNTFKSDYYQWHKTLDNYKRQLVQMTYPVGRTPRCKEGTYCLDLVPDMSKPICWCNQNSYDPECIATANDPVKKVAVGSDLSRIRKAFMKIIIHANDTKSPCNPEYNDKIWIIVNSLGKDPRGGAGIVEVMKELAFSQKKVQICDFRQALICDGGSNTCRGKLTCDPGKVHLGKGVCAVNNGFRCQSTEECVENARCKILQGAMDSVCVCENGYGNKCELEHRAFFMGRFLPITSGYEGSNFINLQVEVNNIIKLWEDSMTQSFDEPCDPKSDSMSMDIVKYFGNLNEYDKELGQNLTKRVAGVLKDGPKMCHYNKFLRCDPEKQKCVPILGSHFVHADSSNLANGKEKIVIEIKAEKECVLTAPLIFEESVTFRCVKGYKCKKTGISAICSADCSSIFAPSQQCSEVENDETTTEAGDTSFESNSIILERKSNDTHGLHARIDSEVINDLDDTTIKGKKEVIGSSTATFLNIDDLNFHEFGEPVAEETTTDSPFSTFIDFVETITFVPTLPEDVASDPTLPEDIAPTLNSPKAIDTTTEKMATTLKAAIEKIQEVGKLPKYGFSANATNTPVNTSKPVITTKSWNQTTMQPTSTPPWPEEDNEIKYTPRKARFGEVCMFNDNRQNYPLKDTIDICDAADYLICFEQICECYDDLMYSETHKKCVVPIGERCQEHGVSLPAYMNMRNLPCEYGICKLDTAYKICRPESDKGMVMVAAKDLEDDDGAIRMSQDSYILVIGALLLILMI